MRNSDYLRLYAVTDRRWLQPGESLAAVSERALAGGVTCLQLREKQLGREEMQAEAEAVLPLCRRYGVPLIIDDDVELALSLGADGVHLGQGDLVRLRAAGRKDLRKALGLPRGMLLGISAHDAAEARAAEAAGADYLGVGALFATGTKEDAHAVSPAALREIRAAVSLPLVGIGGLTEENIPRLAGEGLAGFALVSAIFGAADVQAAARRLAGLTRTVLTPPVLSVAGSDSSGGAGIQADLKTMAALGVYGMTAIAALTAQNTLGVRAAVPVEPDFLAAQMDAVFEDIPPRAVKTGMIATAELTGALAERLGHYRAVNVVADPVMVATSGAALAEEEAVAAMKQELFPLARVITPNIPEAERLTGRSIGSRKDMEQAARALGEEIAALQRQAGGWTSLAEGGPGCAVLVKGGHSLADADDVLWDGGRLTWLRGVRVETANTHGTGCTLSSAIASYLALGWPLRQAVAQAKEYLSGALAAGLDLGHGSGPLCHQF